MTPPSHPQGVCICRGIGHTDFLGNVDARDARQSYASGESFEASLAAWRLAPCVPYWLAVYWCFPFICVRSFCLVNFRPPFLFIVFTCEQEDFTPTYHVEGKK